MGIGNELKGDDSVGPYIAKNLERPDWLSLNCVTVPGNFTSAVKRHHPEVLVLVDAAKMGLEPGQIRLIPRTSTDSTFASTHTVPISATLNYIGDYAERIILIGIEAKNLDPSAQLSPEVKESADRLIEILSKTQFSKIKKLDN